MDTKENRETDDYVIEPLTEPGEEPLSAPTEVPEVPEPVIVGAPVPETV